MRLIIFHLLIMCNLGTLDAQLIDSIPEDRSVVYFMRPGHSGGMVGFVFFDGDQVIGKISWGKYFKYECTPGEHVFWAKSENRSFIHADLAPGKLYIIETKGIMGLMRAQVQLQGVNAKTDKLKKFQKHFAERNSDDLSHEKQEMLQDQLEDYITRGLKRYEKMKANRISIAELHPEMSISPEDLKYQPKTKQKKKKSQRMKS